MYPSLIDCYPSVIYGALYLVAVSVVFCTLLCYPVYLFSIDVI